MIRLTVFVTDTTAPFLQQGRGLLIITIIDINEQPPVSYTFSFFYDIPSEISQVVAEYKKIKTSENETNFQYAITRHFVEK